MVVCTVLALIGGDLAFARGASEPSEWQIRALSASIEEMQQELRGTKLGLELAEERCAQQDKLLTSLREEIKHLRQELASQTLALSQKADLSEQSISKLTGQIRQVQAKAAEDATAFASASARIQQIETSVASQMHQLKSILESMKKTLGDSLATPSAHPKVAHAARPGENVYVVKPGDTLGKIAQQNRTSVAKIRELNQLASDRIHSGQQLLIPSQAANP